MASNTVQEGREQKLKHLSLRGTIMQQVHCGNKEIKNVGLVNNPPLKDDYPIWMIPLRSES